MKEKKHPYSDYIAEIECGWKKAEIILDLKKVLSQNILNSELEESQAEVFFEFLIDKLTMIYGGPNRLGPAGEQEYFRKSYRNVFNNLTTRSVIAGLYQIASGNTEYKKFPPTALEFQEVCRNAPKIPDYPENNQLKLVEIITSREESLKNIATLKNMLSVKDSSQIEFNNEKNKEFASDADK